MKLTVTDADGGLADSGSGAASETNPPKPPNPPWQPLEPADEAGGFVMYYYSDKLSPLPVREVTRPGDNKSDPNLETGTFGLFSTCGRKLRQSVVEHRWPHIFFLTRQDDERVLAGYYHVAWYAPGVFGPEEDVCLAADHLHFLGEPISVSEADQRCNTPLHRHQRGFLKLTEGERSRLLELLQQQPDATQKHLEEIARLERFNQAHSGFRYVAWGQTERFSWKYAAENGYLQPSEALTPEEPPRNESPTDQWRCISCDAVIENRALLKRCPSCGTQASLRPQTEEVIG